MPDTPALSAAEYLASGRQQLACGDHEGGVRSYLAANALQPDNPQTSLGLGMAFSLAGRHAEARITLEHALSLAPEDADYAFALAEAHKRAGNIRTAEKIYRQILLCDPQHLMTAHNLGSLLYGDERFAEAAQRHLLTLQDHPGSVMTWRDLGQSLIAANQLADGLAVLETAHETFPEDHTTRFALGLAYLRNESWEKGWPLYEARWHPDEALLTPPGAAPWAGEPLAGKHLVITHEQGFGDNIMFVRYLPLLAGEATKITLLAPPALATLFGESFAHLDNVTVLSSAEPLPTADFCTPIASLPLHCLERGTIEPPLTIPYLRANPERETRVRATLNSLTPPPENALGLVWRGNENYTANRRRSIPLGELLPRLPTEYRFFSLQRDATAAEKKLLAIAGITDLSAELTDFHDTAAWLNTLDGLLCVDTAIAHLAGALGRPTLLLRRNEGEWRWGHDQSCRCWYSTLTATTIAEVTSNKNGAIIAFNRDR